MPGLSANPPRQRKLLLLAAAALALALLAGWSWQRWMQRPDPKVTTPHLALAGLTGGSLYFNAAARPWLIAQRPDLLTAELRDERSDLSRAFAQAVVNPKLFRQLDRQRRFETLLFIGDPSQYRALLDKLLDDGDFTLSYADHTSLVFRRSGPPWTPAALAPLRADIAALSARDRATVLALTGSKLIAARQTAEGRALLDEALALDPRVPEAWSGKALEQMNRADWSAAIAFADRALAVDDTHLPALAIKMQCLFATKHFNEAFAVSQRLIERLPDDPNILFKHAQIAHEAHAFKSEIEAMEKLIARAQAEDRETTGYRLYLAQAYTAAGQGEKAIENFEQVLRDPTLPADQRDFARDSIKRIKSRTGL